MKNKKNFVVEYVHIVLLALLLSFNYVLFIVKNGFAPAGINGIATMVQYKFGFSIGYFSLIINIPLCVFAFFKINREFAIKSFVFCIVYSLAYLLLSSFDLSAFQYDANGVDTIFPCLLAGIISGVVYGCCFRINASTGGSDIVSKGISKKNPLFNFFWVNFAINAVVAVISIFVYTNTNEQGGVMFNYKPVCLCLIYCFTSSFVGSRIVSGSKQAYKFFIISDYVNEIKEEIIVELRHGATLIKGEGCFSGEEKNVIICVINKHQIVEFKNILKKYPKTFAYVETVNETIGNFKQIKI